MLMAGRNNWNAARAVAKDSVEWRQHAVVLVSVGTKSDDDDDSNDNDDDDDDGNDDEN